MKNNFTVKTTFGYLGLAVAILLLAFSSQIYDSLISFAVNNLSSDHEINLLTKFKIGASFFSLILGLIVMSLFLITNLSQKIKVFLSKIIRFEEIKSFFIDEDICTKNSHNPFTLILGSLAGFAVYFLYLFTGTMKNEGKMEFYTTFLFPIAIAILLISLLQVPGMKLSKKMSHQVMIITAGIAGLIFVYLGEEISWGQQIFHWESAEIFNDYNFQKETNVHNFLNPLFKYVYPIAGFSVFAILFILWIFPSKDLNFLFHFFLPHRSLFFLILLFSCTTFLDYREISEEVFSIICVFYSYRIYHCTRYPRIK